MRTLVFGTLMYVALGAIADDSVEIRYFLPYPRMDRSSEVVTIKVVRSLPVTAPGYEPKLDQVVDQYFADISSILRKASASPSWSPSAVHSPFVEVEISIGGKKSSLGTSYSSRGLDSLPGPDDTNQRHREALSAILKLTARHLEETAPAKGM